MKRSTLPRSGFTLIELLVVMSIIMVLAGLTLAGAGFAQTQARKSRATAEIQALSVALESYKADNGDYPRSKPVGGKLGSGNEADSLDAHDLNEAKLNETTDHTKANSGSAKYKDASLALYAALSGDMDLNGFGGDIDTTTSTKSKIYFEFKPNMLWFSPEVSKGNSNSVLALVDPWGNPYGYSTAYSADTATPPTKGYNPTFDLWSTGDPDSNATDVQQKWLKNW